MTTYLEIEFACTAASDKATLIALQAQRGFTGFEKTNNSLKTFIPKNEFRKENGEPITTELRLS
jgi:hypothetical protein